MTCYIANHEKASRVLAKKEMRLLHAIKNDYAQEKVIKAAEQVWEAKLKVFKAQFSAKSVLPAHAYKPDAEAQSWQAVPVEELIEAYKKEI